MGDFNGRTQPPCRALAFSCGPLGLDFHSPLSPGCVVAEAAPFPILRLRAQPTLDRIAMDVAQLLNEFFMIAYVAVVIALLPEVFSIADQSQRDALLKRFQGIG